MGPTRVEEKEKGQERTFTYELCKNKFVQDKDMKT
jgi:hypothetical protein